MKISLALIAAGALVGSMAMASEKTIAGEAEYADVSAPLAAMAVDDIEGLIVNGAGGQKLGDVDEVVIDRNHQKMVVIGLNDSTREVVVPLSRFHLTGKGKILSSDLTMADLAGAPDYDPGDMTSADE